MSHYTNTSVFTCVFLCASDNPTVVLWISFFPLIRQSPSIQLAVESVINMNTKSMQLNPHEVKWGLIIEYQCSVLFCNVPKKQNKEVQRKKERGARRMFFFKDGCELR